MSAKAKEIATAEGAAEDSDRPRTLARLWAGVLVAPVAFLCNLQFNYTVAQKLCPGGHTLFLHLMTIFFMLLAAFGGLIAWLNWQRAGRVWPDESQDNNARNRFMGALGLMFSVLCFLIIVAQWIPQFVFSPCQR